MINMFDEMDDNAPVRSSLYITFSIALNFDGFHASLMINYKFITSFPSFLTIGDELTTIVSTSI